MTNMREIIQKVVATEGEAKQLLQASRMAADQLLERAQAQARALVEQARVDARRAAAQLLEAAEGQAQQDKTALMTRATAEIQTSISLDDTTRRQIAEAAARFVAGFY